MGGEDIRILGIRILGIGVFGARMVKWGRRRQRSAVDVAAVADIHDERDESVIEDGVEDTVVSDADAIGVLSSEFQGTGRPGVGGQCFHSSDKTGLGIVWQPVKFSPGCGFDEDLIAGGPGAHSPSFRLSAASGMALLFPAR